jgi:hypothetical protein
MVRAKSYEFGADDRCLPPPHNQADHPQSRPRSSPQRHLPRQTQSRRMGTTDSSQVSLLRDLSPGPPATSDDVLIISQAPVQAVTCALSRSVQHLDGRRYAHPPGWDLALTRSAPAICCWLRQSGFAKRPVGEHYSSVCENLARRRKFDRVLQGGEGVRVGLLRSSPARLKRLPPAGARLRQARARTVCTP